jgi:hypothetical protein
MEYSLAYTYADERTPTPFRVQDPDEHYWVYFTTAKNEELILDCGLLPFDHWSFAESYAYGVPSDKNRQKGRRPCYFRTVEQDAVSHYQHTEYQRHSVLQDPGLAQIFTRPASESININTFEIQFYLSKFTDRPVTSRAELERRLVEERVQFTVEMARTSFVMRDCFFEMSWLGEVLESREWEKFPAVPVLYTPDPTLMTSQPDLKFARERAERGRRTAGSAEE